MDQIPAPLISRLVYVMYEAPTHKSHTRTHPDEAVLITSIVLIYMLIMVLGRMFCASSSAPPHIATLNQRTIYKLKMCVAQSLTM